MRVCVPVLPDQPCVSGVEIALVECCSSYVTSSHTGRHCQGEKNKLTASSSHRGQRAEECAAGRPAAEPTPGPRTQHDQGASPPTGQGALAGHCFLCHDLMEPNICDLVLSCDCAHCHKDGIFSFVHCTLIWVFLVAFPCVLSPLWVVGGTSHACAR